MRKSVGVRVRAFGILAMVVLARVRQKSTFVHRSIGRVLRTPIGTGETESHRLSRRRNAPLLRTICAACACEAFSFHGTLAWKKRGTLCLLHFILFAEASFRSF